MPTPSPAALDQVAVADGLDRLILSVRRGTPIKMSSTSITTLDTLAYAGPLRITDLAEREGVSQPGMTTLVNRLAGDGYAERFADRTDGRVALVRINPAGRQVLAERAAGRSTALRAVIARLLVDHQTVLGAALDAMHALTQTTPNYETRTHDPRRTGR